MTDAQRGRRLRGASTISQQVAKNLFLWPGQSWVRKGLEAWFTVWIELLWPKRRILEVYLNVAAVRAAAPGASRRRAGATSARPPRASTAPRGGAARRRAAEPDPLSRREPRALRAPAPAVDPGQMNRLGGTRLLDSL